MSYSCFSASYSSVNSAFSWSYKEIVYRVSQMHLTNLMFDKFINKTWQLNCNNCKIDFSSISFIKNQDLFRPTGSSIYNAQITSNTNQTRIMTHSIPGSSLHICPMILPISQSFSSWFWVLTYTYNNISSLVSFLSFFYEHLWQPKSDQQNK